MAQEEEVPVLPEDYLMAVSYLEQYKGSLSGLAIMKWQLRRGEDLSDTQVKYIIELIRSDYESV